MRIKQNEHMDHKNEFIAFPSEGEEFISMTRTDTNANFPATRFHRYLPFYLVVCHQWRAVTKPELMMKPTSLDTVWL